MDKDIEKLNEEIAKLKEEIERLHKIIPSIANGVSDVYVPANCVHCKNHPSNGGTGICHCILGSQVMY